jgi:hypothetical protein
MGDFILGNLQLLMQSGMFHGDWFFPEYKRLFDRELHLITKKQFLSGQVERTDLSIYNG